MSQVSKSFVVLNASHASEIPELAPLVGNIVQFMQEIGGGAVLVLLKPRREGGSARFEIHRIDNGPDAARRAGWPAQDYAENVWACTMVSGVLRPPKPVKRAAA